jgi:DNA-binding MarR family transcriptional regulator
MADATLSGVPGWVPGPARAYLAHTVGGCSIRALARVSGRHASTILRQVRRMEGLRDDFLVDNALRRLGLAAETPGPRNTMAKDGKEMSEAMAIRTAMPDEVTIEREARRILRRMSEPGACLAVARDMENAVVVRDTADGRTVRTAVVGRAVAEAMALKDWLSCATRGRIDRYRITATGRAALKRLLAEEEAARAGRAAECDPFGDQHRDLDEREVGAGPKNRTRFNLAESPLQSLARRKDRSGAPFLAAELVAAGERLREDFELAQMGPRITQNWERFLSSGGAGPRGSGAPAEGPQAARERVQRALSDLGPGLADAALRTCCFLEGMEAVERRMGWAARSGKIVLRIALQRLKRHYDEAEGGWSPMIG